MTKNEFTQDTFKIQQRLSFIELYKAVLYISLRNKKFKKFYYLIPGLILFASGVSFILTPKKDHSHWISLLPSILLPALFPIVFFFAVLFLISILSILIKPYYFKDVTYEFTYWGVIKKGKRFEQSFQWKDFLSLRETKSFILLYLTQNDALIIQKKMFANTGELENFKNFLDNQLGPLARFL